MKRFWKRSLAVLAILLLASCAEETQKDRDFFTSGSREADQRAEQQVAKMQQLRGQGVNEEKQNVKKSLYERIGGEKGIQLIVDDFVARSLADPRVNWERKNVKSGGVLGVGAKSAAWDPNPNNVENLKKHLAQFFCVATGGPVKYEGRDMAEVHKRLGINNAEFDAAMGDLKASLDKIGLPTQEQKELLSIVESTRPQVSHER